MREVLIGFLFILTLTIAGAAIVWGPGYLRHREASRLRAEGMPAMALIVALDDTGSRFNDAPEIEIRVEVSAEGRAPWPASFRRVMDVSDIQVFTPGRRIPVRFDPARPERIAFAP